MKLNKNKIIVSALALAIGGSLVGSVSSTIAWYQYSTRANVSFLGTASGISGNLQMRFVGENDNAWRTKITYQEIAAELAANHYAEKVVPMTYGALDKDENVKQKAYIQPVLGVSDTTKWVEASEKNYAQFELELRYNERDGVEDANNVDAENVAKDLYLSKLLIQQDYQNAANEKKDLSDAVRVHIHTYKSDDEEHTAQNKLISKQGGTTATSGKLDLDGDTLDDTVYSGTDDGAEFGFGQGTAETAVVYGSGIQTAYSASAVVNAAHKYLDANEEEQTETTYPALVNSQNNKLTDLKYATGSGEVDKKIGSLVAGNEAYLRVRVTIWVEGWQKLSDYGEPAKYKAIWDEVKYVNSMFDVGIQFAVQDAFAE